MLSPKSSGCIKQRTFIREPLLKDSVIMDLLKYLPEHSNGNTIKCNNLQSLYVFQGFTLTDKIPCGIFLTSNDFFRPDLAQDKLSISFRPKVEVEIASDPPFNVWRNYGGIIRSSGSDDQYSRVWPAFGYTGGAYEYVYECRIFNQNQGRQIVGKRREYHTGGLKDFFYGQTVRLQNCGLTQTTVIQDFLKNLSSVFGQYELNEQFGIYGENTKIIKLQENGLILAILAKNKRNLNISISLGVRDLSQYSVCNLWIYFWIDDYANRRRDVYGPVQKSWLFRWRSQRTQRQPPFTVSISKVTNTLLRDALKQFQRGTLVIRRNLILP